MKKRFLPLLMILVVLLGCTTVVPVYATERESIYKEPILERYTYINRFICDLRIVNGTANVSVFLDSTNSSVPSITARITLQEKNGSTWVTKRSWTETSTGNSLYMNKTYNVTSGKTYRAIATATVYTETVSLTTGAQTAN